MVASAPKLPPGPKGLPLLGNIFQLASDQLRFLAGVQHLYGRMATLHVGRTPVIVLFQPEHVRYVLTENARNFTNREVAGGLVFGKLLIFSQLTRRTSSKAAADLRKLVGDGLLTTDGEYHDRQRRLLQPAFSKKRIEKYAELIVRYTREAMDTWRPGEEIDLASQMQALVFRLIAKILIDTDVLEVPESRAIADGMMNNPVSIAEGLVNLPIDLPFTSYGKRMAAIRRCDAILYDLIERRRVDNRDVGDILSILLAAEDENGEKMTSKQIRDEIVSLLAAGHETTTNTLVWTMFLLSEHPDVFAKLQTELHTRLGGRAPDVGDLPNLTYLAQVIKESMRLFPSGWVQGRQAVNDFELDGYHFPAGTLLMFNQWVLHRRPDLWEDAESFTPERWDRAQGKRAVPWAYFPFGGGSRVCMGQSLSQLEVHLVLPIILQRFFPHMLPGHHAEPLPLLTLRSKGGMPVRLEPVRELSVPTMPHKGIPIEMPGCPVDQHASRYAHELDNR